MNRPKTDPTLIFRYRDGLYAVELLAAAITGLDLFTRHAKEPADLKTLCKMFGIHERPADVMLTLFAAMELRRWRDGVFELTETAREFLSPQARSKRCISSAPRCRTRDTPPSTPL